MSQHVVKFLGLALVTSRLHPIDFNECKLKATLSTFDRPHNPLQTYVAFQYTTKACEIPLARLVKKSECSSLRV